MLCGKQKPKGNMCTKSNTRIELRYIQCTQETKKNKKQKMLLYFVKLYKTSKKAKTKQKQKMKEQASVSCKNQNNVL